MKKISLKNNLTVKFMILLQSFIVWQMQWVIAARPRWKISIKCPSKKISTQRPGQVLNQQSCTYYFKALTN